MRITATILVLLALALAGCGDKSVKTGATDSGPVPGIGDTRDCPDSKKQPRFDVTMIFGLDRVKAEQVVKENGYTMRAVYVDGEPKAATMDYKRKRLNVAIRDGKVTQLCSIG